MEGRKVGRLTLSSSSLSFCIWYRRQMLSSAPFSVNCVFCWNPTKHDSWTSHLIQVTSALCWPIFHEECALLKPNQAYPVDIRSDGCSAGTHSLKTVCFAETPLSMFSKRGSCNWLIFSYHFGFVEFFKFTFLSIWPFLAGLQMKTKAKTAAEYQQPVSNPKTFWRDKWHFLSGGGYCFSLTKDN